jgi:probable HAF family extracellular repeat protein
MKNRHHPSFAVLLTLAAISTISRAAEPRYHLIDLGSLGGRQFWFDFSGIKARLLNNDGTVVGGSSTPDPDPFQWNDGFTSHAFEWKNGALADLAPTAFGDKANFSQAFWVNDLGHSVGIATYNASNPAKPLFKAMLWKDRQMIDLGTLGGDQSYAHAINNRDQVVGWALNAVPTSARIWWEYPYPFGTQQRAALWENGSVQDLGDLGGPCGWGIGINDAGQIIGQSLTAIATGTQKQVGEWLWARPVAGFIWQNGTMVDLGNLGGTFVLPRRINKHGQVIGLSMRRGDGSFHPFLWEQGVMKDLGTLGGNNGSANAINDAGEIVGGAALSNGGFHAFLWKDGVMKDLGTVRERAQAWHINSKSQIVGTTGGDAESSNRAFLWESGGPMVDLNTIIPKGSPMTLRFPLAINDAGEILCYGVLPSGDSHPALLVPLPRLNVRASTTAASQKSVALDLKVSAGRKYVLESSRDLTTWTPIGDPFLAQDDNLTRELELQETQRFFRLARVL